MAKRCDCQELSCVDCNPIPVKGVFQQLFEIAGYKESPQGGWQELISNIGDVFDQWNSHNNKQDQITNRDKK